MRLDDADDDIDALASLLVRRLQHGVGLSNPGICAEKDLELAFHPMGFFGLYTFEHCVGIWAL